MSLAIYQKEIIDQLLVWSKNHTLEELDAGVTAAISRMPVGDQSQALATWTEIQSKIK